MSTEEQPGTRTVKPRRRKHKNLHLSIHTIAHLDEIEARTGRNPSRTIDEWSLAERTREARQARRDAGRDATDDEAR